MLHVETYYSQHPSLDKNGRLTSARVNILKHFDKWISCTCSKMCEVRWNFVNTDGIHRAGNERCKVVAAMLDCESKRSHLVVMTSWNLGRLNELRRTWAGQWLYHCVGQRHPQFNLNKSSINYALHWETAAYDATQNPNAEWRMSNANWNGSARLSVISLKLPFHRYYYDHPYT